MALEALRGHYGEIPEFVGIGWVSRYINFPVLWIRHVKLLDNLPYKIGGKQDRLYRWTEVKKRLVRYKLLPPDTNHPYHRYTAAEIVALMDVNGHTFLNQEAKGHINVLRNEKGEKFVYNTDFNLFRRNYDMRYIVGQIDAPVSEPTIRTIFDIDAKKFKKLVAKGILHTTPRVKGQRIKYRIDDLYNLITDYTRYRKSPMPEEMPAELAQLYSGLGKSFSKYVALKSLPVHHGVDKRGDGRRYFLRSEIDAFVLKMWCIQCYCDNKDYYTRSAIKYKFGKCDLWIDTFVSNKCTQVYFGKLKADKKPFFRGWKKEEVEALVNSGVEVEPEVFIPKKMRHPVRAVVRDEKKLQPAFHKAAADLIEDAINMAFTERDAKREAHVLSVHREQQAIYRQRADIRRELNYETKASETFTHNALLRLSNEREIVTLMYTRNKNTALYKRFKHSKYECVIACSDRAQFTRRPVQPSIGRIINGGLNRLSKMELRCVPLWIVIVAGTSVIPDINFYEKLRNVPPTVGAVSAYGYEYRLPDGTWTRCAKTYGMYSMYHTGSVDTSFIIGTGGVNGSHPVAVMGGPFVAIRGEYLNAFRGITHFNALGDCRAAIGPILSAICTVKGISMMQIPVDCGCASDYEYRPDSVEWHRVEDSILRYERANGIVKY